MKRKLGLSLSISVVFLSLTSGILASIAWYNTTNSITVDVNGSVVEEYFHTGDGSSAHPYVITRPIHFYHLVEFFQRETSLPPSNDFGTDYLYFQVGYDLDNDGDLEVYNYDDAGTYLGTSDAPSYSSTLNMAYYSGTNALMPIGTNEVPFIGSFDGKASEGIVISNLNIHCAETVVVGNQTVNRAASDIGIFGYVADKDSGNTPTVIKDAKFNGITIDLSDVTTTVASSVTGVNHEATHNSIAYVGYIAGHVHNYYNYSSTGPTNASPLYNVYVDNATIKGGAGVVCNYGYIGLVDYIDDKAPALVTDEVGELQEAAGGHASGDDWGGSINIRNLDNRIYTLLNTGLTTYNVTSNASALSTVLTGHGVKTSTGYHWYYSDANNSISTFDSGSSTYYTKNPESNTVVYRLGGAQNVRASSSPTNYTSRPLFPVPHSVLPLLVDDSNNYSVKSGNTGYIVGGSTGSGSYGGQTTVRVGSYPLTYIGHSISSSGTSSATYVTSQLEVVSITNATSYNANNFGRIYDQYNSSNASVSSTLSSKYSSRTIDSETFKKYSASRDNLTDVLTGASFVHGLHFTGKNVSASDYTTIPTASIYNQSYTNYQLPNHSLDFNLKENGYINFFAGSYYSSIGTNADSFFSLNIVKRSGSNLSSIKEISKIYANTNAATKATHPYVYLCTDSNYSTGSTEVSYTLGDLLFDCQYLWGAPPVANSLYYIEIPANPGEYAMGSHDGKANGTYLIYLDLSANGDGEEQTSNQENAIRDESLFTQIDFQINSFVINSCFNVAYVIPTGSTKENFGITISCGTVTIESNNYTCYEINIINSSGAQFEISALLMDNNDDPDDDYFYMYAITYNGGTRVEYHSSNTYRGASGGTTMTPVYS